jgi:signal transduction histidine kinase
VTEGILNFQLLFEESPDVLLVLLPDAPRFTMVAATKARLAATHTTREQTVGRGLFELFPDNPDDPDATGMANLRASLERVLATRAADTMAVQKYDIRGPDGTFHVKYWSPRNIPVIGPSGDVQYIFHSVEDVTELVHASELGEALRDRTRQMEREVLTRSRELAEANRRLRDANDKLGELDATKTAFFSNVSHEFRTPLTLMLGPLEDALADSHEPLSPAQRGRLQLARDNCLRLLKLVNALLDFSRLEAGRMTASFAPLDLAQLTAELGGMFHSAVASERISLRVECPPLSERIWVDQGMWEKIVPNLVSNALKFTLAGEVAVVIREEPDAAVLEVSDTGVGIPAEDLPRIFERFYRVASTSGRTHEGSGIGLSLVRELVALHGGTVSVESTVGRGTTFRVSIPKGYAHLPPESVSMQATDRHATRDARGYAIEASRWTDAESPPRVQNEGAGPSTEAAVGPEGVRARVLVVDDNPDLRSYLSALLTPGYDVELANHGLDALAAVAARMPDLVVSDVMMPGLDGFGLLRELRRRPETSSLPVVLLSARAGEESAIEGLHAGADDYLVKPFSARELLARVRTHVELARKRREWITQLETANRELDAFSYSVSHDLRAPLRTVDGFSRALAEDCADLLDPRARDYIERISAAVKRMNDLIEDLLELARISRASFDADVVDLSALAEEVVAELRRAQPTREVEVVIAPGLLARGDRRLLSVVFVNLLSNAWKFTAKRAQARIEFGRHAVDPPTFYVRDNGAGFEMAYARRLFAPFQRLHSPSEFEGTGVGLATVQRVLSRHQGRIWVEAAVGQGATFFFTLPDRL